MTNEQIIQSIQFLIPNANVTVRGGEIEWHDERPQPTKQEIQDVLPEAEKAEWRSTFKTDLYKLKIVLDTMGDLEAVEGIISQQSKGVQLAWDNANSIRRNSPTVVTLAQAMEYSDEQLDTIFKQADEVKL